MLSNNPVTRAALPHNVEFDFLSTPVPGQIQLRRATVRDISAGRCIVDELIPGDLAPLETIERVISYNPNNVLLFVRNAKIVGIWAMLMLSAEGLEQLLLGELDARNPHPNALLPKTEVPAAIYKWAIVGPGIAMEGASHVSQYLRQPLYRYSNLFSRPTTPRGLKFKVNLGFRPIQSGTNGLYRYVRRAKRSAQTVIAA